MNDPLTVGEIKVLSIEDAHDLIYGPSLSNRENAIMWIGCGILSLIAGVIFLLRDKD